jgi:cold shock CspA family protein
MTAFNAVRFKVKAGREQQFLDAHNKVAFAWPGLSRANIIKTGEHTFCVIAEWTDMNAIVNARASMIATLDTFRDTLEDLGGGLGVTDPVAGQVVKVYKEAVSGDLNEGQVIEFEEVSNRGKTSAENLKIKR